MNSIVKTFNLRAACMVAALSLTASASLAQSTATAQPQSSASASASTTTTASAGSAASTQTKVSSANAASTTASGATKPGTTPGAAAAQATVVAKTPDLVALQGPTLITQSGAGWKTASSFVDLKEGQQALPLTFTVTNGANGQAKMQGIRIKLNGHEIVNEKLFKGKDQLSVNLSDILTSGQTQLITETYGPQGATLSWVLTTLKIKVSDIKPVNTKIGDKVQITGRNFPTDLTAYKLMVDQTPAKITKATATGIDFTVPEVSGGKRTVTLYIAGVKCDPLYIKVAAAPEVSGVDFLGASPGGNVVINGKGFSTTASENQVILKNPGDGSVMAQCTAIAASDTQITFTLPMDITCPSDVLAAVRTNGQESKTAVSFFCSQRVIDKNTIMPGSW